MNENEIVKEKENPMINVVWKDGGQIVATIKCYPDEVTKINELFYFIKQLDI